ncbi:MAG: phosphate transport system permease protein [Frankiaceae bacterium]|jgi:phosphate transport system permease protein|nr:phosphate transport system permease protein [Frankiaceae bacterium]
MTTASATPAGAHATTVVSSSPMGARLPRSHASVRRSDVLAIAGSLAAAFSATGLVFRFLAPFSGPIGYVIVSYAVFLVLYLLVVSLDEPRPTVVDRCVGALAHSLALLVFCALLLVLAFTALRGARALSHSNFFTQDMRHAGPLDPLTVGGIVHAALGTLIMTGIALAITIPLGVCCAVFLTEFPGRFSRFVRTIVEAMTALPSIVAGLFIYATWILTFHRERSGFAAALALSVMMLPIIIRSSDVVIRLVPSTLKEASYALGTGQWRTVWHVVLPTVRSGLVTAVILGTARGIGETSPVLLTAGFTAGTNVNPLHQPMISLPLATFQFVKSSEPNVIARGFGSAVVLFAMVLVLFVVARVIGGREAGQLSGRQQRAAARRSRRDRQRIDPEFPSRQRVPRAG